MKDGLVFYELRGQELLPWVDSLGKLRINVFREYPYLYEGTLDYERAYLKTYVNSPRSLVVLVFDSQSELVGATTCIPLGDEGPEFQRPFLAAGWEVRQICYFGESIVLPEFRGRGLGREFFKIRERHAREHGCRWTCFCAVDRAGQHPMRPKSYRPLDDFWTSLGYMKRPALKASFTWRETGEKFESPKSLTFWTKEWKS